MKTLGVVLAGVFAGVVIFEIIRKAKPGAIKDVEEKATKFASSFRSAFKEGYEGAT